MGIFKLFKLLPQLFIYVYRGLNELCFAPSHDGIKSGRRKLRNAHYENCNIEAVCIVK